MKMTSKIIALSALIVTALATDSSDSAVGTHRNNTVALSGSGYPSAGSKTGDVNPWIVLAIVGAFVLVFGLIWFVISVRAKANHALIAQKRSQNQRPVEIKIEN